MRDHSGEKIINEHLRDLSDLQEYYSVELENGTWGRVSSEGTYMTSLDDFDKGPDWLLGEQPEYGTGHIKKAPAVLFVVDKGNGWVDAFWFYFYPSIGVLILWAPDHGKSCRGLGTFFSTIL